MNGEGTTESLRRGRARIVSNVGDGEYTVTEQVWNEDTGALEDASSPYGLVAATAYDFQGIETGRADGIVRFCEHRGKEDTLVVLIDVTSDTEGEQRTVCIGPVHYAGTNDVTYKSIDGCLNCFIELMFECRECSGDGSGEDHPAYAGAARWDDKHWPRITVSEEGDDAWTEYYFAWISNAPAFSWTRDTTQVMLRYKVSATGTLSLQVRRSAAAGRAFILNGLVRITPFGDPPGPFEIGNCCCHDDPDWDDYTWGDHPDNPL